MTNTNNSFQFSVRQSFVVCGIGAAAQAPGMLKQLGGSKCMLFTDQILNKIGVGDKITKYFAAEPNAPELVGVFDAIEADAKSTIINKAYKFYKEKQADCIIIVGGGSVIDSAKAVMWMDENNVDDVHRIFSEKMKYVDFFPTARPFKTPLIIIPTTAGTGSEVSTTAVIFDEERNVKASIMHQYLGADCAILDAEFTATMPPSLTATTGFDALTHALEGFFSKKANVVTDPHARESIKMIFANLAEATHNGSDLEVREKMLLGNVLGIAVFGTTFAGIPIHNMSLTFGALHHTPHGLAVAILMAPVMRALPEWYMPKIKQFADIIGVDNSGSEQKVLADCIAAIDKLRSDCDIPEKFNINFSDIDMDLFMNVTHTEGGGPQYYIPDEKVIEIVKAVTK